MCYPAYFPSGTDIFCFFCYDVRFFSKVNIKLWFVLSMLNPLVFEFYFRKEIDTSAFAQVYVQEVLLCFCILLLTIALKFTFIVFFAVDVQLLYFFFFSHVFFGLDSLPVEFCRPTVRRLHDARVYASCKPTFTEATTRLLIFNNLSTSIVMCTASLLCLL